MLVLIAEDDIITALALDQTIRAAGHRVLGPAATVSTAFALAEAEPPDLAFVDVRLFHNAEGGYTLAEALRDLLGVPCILASGMPPDEMIARGAGLGFVAKPWAEETIAGTLEFVAALRQGIMRPDVPEGLVLLEPGTARSLRPARFAASDARADHGASHGAPGSNELRSVAPLGVADPARPPLSGCNALTPAR